MSHITERLERDLREIAAGAHPSPSAWESILGRLDDEEASATALLLTPGPDRATRPVWIAAAAAALVVITGSVAVLVTRTDDHQSIAAADPDAGPTIMPTPEPFVGTWTSTDSDGSAQTMEIARSTADDYEFVLRDAFASAACSGAPATMTGTGRLVTDATLLIAQPVLTCDDGTIPSIGPPPQAELADFTFDRNPVTDELTDRFGVVWQRPGSTKTSDSAATASPTTTVEPSTVTVTVRVPSLGSATSGGMWPQSTLDEVRAGQVGADDGDPAFTWQLDPTLSADWEPWGAEIFARFIEEGLGWEAFAGASFAGLAGEIGQFEGILFIRCAPDQTNPLSPLYTDAPSEIRSCAPTVDELTYETVSFSVSQPVRRGLSGIWVVDRWEILQAEYEPGSLFGLLYPDYFAGIKVEQVAPPADAEVTAVLEEFLQARLDGAGAEQHLLREPSGSAFEDTDVPLLYATTSGARYERSEIELVQGPVWPSGWTEYQVRLVAEDATEVEQFFHVVRRDGQLGLIYGYSSNEFPTTENGHPVAVPQNVFGGGTLTVIAPPLRPRGDGRTEITLTSASDGRVIIGEDPAPMSPVRDDCLSVPIGTALPIADDATMLARNIEADPDLETTGAVPVSIAGIDGLQIDVTFSAHDLCYSLWSPSGKGSGTASEGEPTGGWRMRLYLVDYPESAWPSDSAWRPKVLTVAVIAPEIDFERALDEATPILDSLSFDPG